ncbi:hypothetical protein [Streptomyces sp. RFCAC02]|uniref:hypothetical protein n=1 Tax=Streptomyces sp. RFCAC02 TaxID=2499143 RepID=UPI00101F1510|nr:hypothetical protein [Streptomyces sp. RFCAC02]
MSGSGMPRTRRAAIADAASGYYAGPVLTPAPRREENPHITVITGLEGPVVPLGSAPRASAGQSTDESEAGA